MKYLKYNNIYTKSNVMHKGKKKTQHLHYILYVNQIFCLIS